MQHFAAHSEPFYYAKACHKLMCLFCGVLFFLEFKMKAPTWMGSQYSDGDTGVPGKSQAVGANILEFDGHIKHQ